MLKIWRKSCRKNLIDCGVNFLNLDIAEEKPENHRICIGVDVSMHGCL